MVEWNNLRIWCVDSKLLFLRYLSFALFLSQSSMFSKFLKKNRFWMNFTPKINFESFFDRLSGLEFSTNYWFRKNSRSCRKVVENYKKFVENCRKLTNFVRNCRKLVKNYRKLVKKCQKISKISAVNCHKKCWKFDGDYRKLVKKIVGNFVGNIRMLVKNCRISVKKYQKFVVTKLVKSCGKLLGKCQKFVKN